MKTLATFSIAVFLIGFSLNGVAQKNKCKYKADFGFVSDKLDVVFMDSAKHDGFEYFWDFGDNTYSNNRYSSHTYKEPRTYTTCLKVKTSCKTTEICKEIKVSTSKNEAINSENKGVLRLYPNPLKGSFTMRIEDIKGTELKVEVTDIKGKDIFYTEFESTLSTFSTTVDLGSDSRGLYIVYVTIDGERNSTKFFRL